jgi:hypothetical protein
MSAYSWTAILIALPIAVYMAVRFGSAAFYRSKLEFLRRVTNHGPTKKQGKN